MSKKKLTDKEIKFSQEYVIDLDATKAAKRAGYSEKTSGQIGWRLLQKTHVAAEIQKAMDSRSKRTEITADRVLQELARIGFVDPRKIMKVDENGNFVITASDLLDFDDAACISEIQQTVTEHGGSIKIKLHDKLGALDKIGRHLKLFTDVQETKHTFTQMGRVFVGDPNAIDGTPKKELTFNIGQDPNPIDNTDD
jgi:phage terminase small subunit